jgi:2-dehydropantoate 2-reductase
MKIVVVGAGGVGGYFGAQLVRGGHDVVFVARGAQLDAMSRNGLRVESAHAPVTLPQVTATAEISDIADADLVLVAVKLWDTEDVARRLRHLAEGGATVISLQNGVQKDETLRRWLPAESIMGGLCYISAAISEPGVIVQDGSLARIVFGEFGAPEEYRTARAVAIEKAFTAAGIVNEISADIDAEIWKKFIFLVALSSVTSVTRLPIGVLRANRDTRSILLQAMGEAVDVAHAHGVSVPADYASRQMEFIDTLPAEMTSSMLHDLVGGRRLELPWLGGGLVKLAEERGVDAPLTRTLVALLSPHADGAAAA